MTENKDLLDCCVINFTGGARILCTFVIHLVSSIFYTFDNA